MFAPTYFAPGYFAPRYFANDGAAFNDLVSILTLIGYGDSNIDLIGYS